MARRKVTVSPNAHLYAINDSYTMPDGRTIVKDETIKIDGEHGGKFKFLQHVVRTDNSVAWIDCFEIRSGVMCAWRSFKPKKIIAPMLDYYSVEDIFKEMEKCEIVCANCHRERTFNRKRQAS